VERAAEVDCHLGFSLPEPFRNRLVSQVMYLPVLAGSGAGWPVLLPGLDAAISPLPAWVESAQLGVLGWLCQLGGWDGQSWRAWSLH
jgi:hypothetical protein